MVVVEAVLQLLNLARAEKRAGGDLGQADDLSPPNLKLGQGGGKRDRLGQPVFGQAAGVGRLQRGMQDIGARRCCGGVAQALTLALGEEVVVILGRSGDQSSPS